MIAAENSGDSSLDMPEPQVSDQVMNVVLNHYINHNKVVLEKLKIAQIATTKSIEEIQKISNTLESSADMPAYEKVQSYENMWGDVIELFQNYGATEEELNRIEDILINIPKAIKLHYEKILEQDMELNILIKKLHTDEYKKAFAIVESVQEKMNPMSGLQRDEYEPDTTADNVIAYRFNPDMLKER